uniref:Uncharacterized protein n=1 Tax=Eptatretus burgeri TaxID=7764 RepID=A0A8C4X1P0_EPTBU
MEAVAFAQSQQSRLGRDQQALAHTMQDMPEIEEIPQPEGKRETTKTWLQIKEEEAMLEEKKKYEGQTWQLHEDVQKLQEELLQLMDENTKCPELERLEWSEFFLDPEEWQRLEAEGKHHLKEMEEKVEMDKMSNQYLQHLITKECWDELSVKARSVKAFLSELEVHNYAIKERSDEELQNLQRVIMQREIEIADKKIQEELIVMQRKEEEVEEEEEGAAQEIKGFAVTGSLSASIGIDSPYLYCQFDLHTREQRMNQMMLLKVIHNSLHGVFPS